MFPRLALALSCLLVVTLPLAAQEWPLHFAEYSNRGGQGLWGRWGYPTSYEDERMMRITFHLPWWMSSILQRINTTRERDCEEEHEQLFMVPQR